MTFLHRPNIHIMSGYSPEQGLELPPQNIRIADAQMLSEYGGVITYSALAGKGLNPFRSLNSEVRFRDLSHKHMVLGPYVTIDANGPFAPDASIALWSVPEPLDF